MKHFETEESYEQESYFWIDRFGSMLIVLCGFVAPDGARAQVRPQYVPGINATNSGLMPDPGFTYANVFQDFSFNELKGPQGERLPVNVNGNVTVLVDNNIIEWVSKKKILGGK
jgi:hypothetical protein